MKRLRCLRCGEKEAECLQRKNGFAKGIIFSSSPHQCPMDKDFREYFPNSHLEKWGIDYMDKFVLDALLKDAKK